MLTQTTSSSLVHRAPATRSFARQEFQRRIYGVITDHRAVRISAKSANDEARSESATSPTNSSLRSSSESSSSATNSSLIQTERLDVTESPYYRELSKTVDAIDATRFLKAPSDFFELLDLDLDDADVWASRDEAMVQSIVQTAFKKKLKISHPDVLTSKYADISEEETNGFAVILNAAYKTLSDRQTREPYLLAVIDFRKHFFLSEETKFDGTPVSKWSGEEGETRAVFVDESECIGCGNCAQYAAKTFSMDVDKDYGRARVINQWADDSETIEIAIDMCPVDCIWFVKRNQLAALEHCMKFCPREDPGIMGRRRGGNFGSQRAKHNPFSAAESFLKRFDENGELFGGKNPAGLSFSWHDERLASTIAKAWLSLPAEVRRQGWSEFKHKFNTSGVGGDYSVEDRTFLKTR